MPVLVWAREESRSRVAAAGHEVAADKGDLFDRSDVLSLHMRLVPATRGRVTAEDLARMHESALFVSTSRAGLVEPGALVEALERGRPGLAGGDVFDEEPQLGPVDPLVLLDNVVSTPHIGYLTRDEWELQFRDIFGQVDAFASGTPTNVVNPDVLGHRRQPPPK